jgi:hypothetical protein
MKHLFEVISAGTKLVKGIVNHALATKLNAAVPTTVDVAVASSLHGVAGVERQDISRGGQMVYFGGAPDELLVHPLLNSIEAVLAFDSEAFAKVITDLYGHAHLYSGDGAELLNERITAAARCSGAGLSFMAIPHSLETCPVVNFVARCMMDAWCPSWFPVPSDSEKSREISVQRLADVFWSQRRSGTGKSYSVLSGELIPLLQGAPAPKLGA